MTQVERDPSQTDRAFSLRLAMRRLWSDHVIWTREYVVAVTPGAHVAALSETASAAAARLLRNQEDIGNAIVPFYGSAAGAQLTDLLKQHIMIAVELISAASTGDNAQFKRPGHAVGRQRSCHREFAQQRQSELARARRI